MSSDASESSTLIADPVETRRPFLCAHWANLALVTYAVDPSILLPFLPPGCELDLREGNAFVSLVAFDFLKTRVMGIRWPGFVNFPEINLRFYVRHGADRGVSFIREFVPHRVVAKLARAFYSEPYVAAAMTSGTTQDDRQICIEHHLTHGGAKCSLRLTGLKPAIRPGRDSTEHFFKEHSWGFGTRRGRRVRYHVAHPEWDVWPVKSLELDWDWEAIYGRQWGFLQDAEPYSVVLAAGSEVRVYPKFENA